MKKFLLLPFFTLAVAISSYVPSALSLAFIDNTVGGALNLAGNTTRRALNTAGDAVDLAGDVTAGAVNTVGAPFATGYDSEPYYSQYPEYEDAYNY